MGDAMRTCLFVISLAGLLPAQQAVDVLITGGRLLDGTGNPAIQGDIGIRGNRIVAVGRLNGWTATRIVDAKGKYVAPGFIDMHSHAERGLESSDRRRRSAPNLVTQGITYGFGESGRLLAVAHGATEGGI
jgi:N-acyl-D-amino-acid deacylase